MDLQRLITLRGSDFFGYPIVQLPILVFCDISNILEAWVKLLISKCLFLVIKILVEDNFDFSLELSVYVSST